MSLAKNAKTGLAAGLRIFIWTGVVPLAVIVGFFGGLALMKDLFAWITG